MRTQSCNRRKLDAHSQLGLTYTNRTVFLTPILLVAQTVCSRDLSMLEMIIYDHGLNVVKSYQPFRIDPLLTDENITGHVIGCEMPPESLSTIKDGT